MGRWVFVHEIDNIPDMKLMLYTTGEWKVDPNKDITFPLVRWLFKLFPILDGSDIEINQVDLGDEFAFGFCQQDDGEFLIHVHNRMDLGEYVKTLIHEITHVRQTLDGITDSNARENEAYHLEEVLSKEFWDSYISGTQ